MKDDTQNNQMEKEQPWQIGRKVQKGLMFSISVCFKYKFEPFSMLLPQHIYGVLKVPTATVTNCDRDSIRHLKGAAVFVSPSWRAD